MHSERLSQVEEIYHAALELPETERSSFVRESCGDDDELRAEVESILSFDKKYNSFIDELPQTLVSDAFSAGEEDLSDREIGRYRVRRLIGNGGMGRVYLADDTGLGRPVAIKILPPHLAGDSERFRRFDREAKFVTRLNHPNILTVFEVASFEGQKFIVSEYVDGETLREMLGKGRLELQRSLDIAFQVAAALEAAHRAKIAHRDIKPENIMVRGDGLVKVLDFGIAKLVRESAGNGPSHLNTPAITGHQTREGMMLGTSFYMSPEQARGEEIDTRTDIWSLGVIIYEMLSGRLPFNGPTTSDYIASVLKSDPLPMETGDEEMPPDLQELIYRSLRKDRDSRYQTVEELIVDLEDIKNEISFAGRLERSNGRGKQEQSPDAKTHDAYVETTDGMALPEECPARELLPEAAGKHGRRRLAAAAVPILIIFAAVLTAGLLGWRKSGPLELSGDAFQKMQLTKLTFEGNAGSRSSVSPDGKYIAYVLAGNSKQSLHVRQVAAAGTVEIVPPADIVYRGLRFAPDGNNIYYTAHDRTRGAALFKIPVLGGTPRKITGDADGIPAISPDGKRIAYFTAETSLMVAEIDGGLPYQLAAPPPGEVWRQAAWRPDGSSISTSLFSVDEEKDYIADISIADGAEKRLSALAWNSIDGFEWLADGSGIILCGRRTEAEQSQVWLVVYPSGEIRRITNDFSNYIGVNLTADNRSLITVKYERRSNIWIASEATRESAREVIHEEGRDEGISGIAEATDGRIVYTIRSGENTDLWIVNADGSGNRQLTFDQGTNFSPAISPDGRYIVFVSTRSGNNIWRMDIDGDNVKQLTDSPEFKSAPRFTPDGKWLIYEQSDANDRRTFCKTSVDGGASLLLAHSAWGIPAVSPDGRFFAGGIVEEGQTSPRLALFPVEGGKPVKILDFPAVARSNIFYFSADGKSLIYRDKSGRASNLWSQPLDGTPPRQLTFFDSGEIYRFDLMHGGRGFILARGSESSDVVMLSNFR